MPPRRQSDNWDDAEEGDASTTAAAGTWDDETHSSAHSEAGAASWSVHSPMHSLLSSSQLSPIVGSVSRSRASSSRGSSSRSRGSSSESYTNGSMTFDISAGSSAYDTSAGRTTTSSNSTVRASHHQRRARRTRGSGESSSLFRETSSLKLLNLLLTICATVFIVGLYDENARPDILLGHLLKFGIGGEREVPTIHVRDPLADPEEGSKNEERRLRGNKKQEFEMSLACGSNSSPDDCNGSSDHQGNSCHWCAEHTLLATTTGPKTKCVTRTSLEYKFAPCNNWVCENKMEPEKSELSSCERI